MKYSLFTCLMLCFGLSFAQLSVRNNAYLYVNDQVLYVEDDINLEEATARLYLRNESQLLQGAGTTGNSGIGELSIYQNGTTNQWAYNYWCSPVGNILANTNGNRAFRFNQIDDPRLDTTSDLIDSSDPTFVLDFNSDDTTIPMTISRYWAYTFISSDEYNGWSYVGNPTDDISAGLGFTMKGSGTGLTGNTTYDFRGKPNSGDISNSVAAGQFTLIGNPYPSAIDSAAFIHDSQNQMAITGTLFYWEQDGSVASHTLQEYIGGYYEFTINSSGTMITETPAAFKTYDENDNVFDLPVPTDGIKTAGRYIPIGQGFMVEGSATSTGTVTLKNSFRSYVKEGVDSYFFRNHSINSKTNENYELQYQENGLSIVPEDFKRFRINVDFVDGEVDFTRQLVLNFNDSATMGFDYGLELSRGETFASDTYFSLDDKAYSAQAYPFDESLTIPIIVDIEEQQPLRFRIFDIQNFDDAQGIYIHDIEENIYVNLRNQNYDLNIEPGHYAERFEIVFSNQALSIDEYSKNTLTIHQDNDNNQLFVLNPTRTDIKAIEIYDLLGKLMIQNHYDSILERYNLSSLRLSDGVYIVNVLSDSNTTIKSQKVIVKN